MELKVGKSTYRIVERFKDNFVVFLDSQALKSFKSEKEAWEYLEKGLGGMI